MINEEKIKEVGNMKEELEGAKGKTMYELESELMINENIYYCY